MKTCILIGGNSEELDIDKKIIELSKKDNPNFLYIGLANSYADSRYDQIKKIYKNYNCNTKYLKKSNVINNPKLVEEKIKEADIIYIDGGDTIKLLDYVKNYEIESLLKDAYSKGTIMVGISAGAILLSNEGLSDSYILRKEKDTYEFLQGLNFVNVKICPHYTMDKERIIKAKNKEKGIVYGLPNGTALIITNNKIKKIESLKNKIESIE